MKEEGACEYDPQPRDRFSFKVQSKEVLPREQPIKLVKIRKCNSRAATGRLFFKYSVYFAHINKYYKLNSFGYIIDQYHLLLFHVKIQSELPINITFSCYFFNS